jgi:signal transduction histidine kinase
MVALELAQSAPQHAVRALTMPVLSTLPAARPIVHPAPTSTTTYDLLFDIAHELRSPLLSFKVSLDVLAEDPAMLSAEDGRRLVNSLQRSAVHVQTLIENLLDAASIGSSRFSIVPGYADLAAVVLEAIAVVEPLLGPNGQTIQADLPPEAPMIRADSQRVRQVLVNLLHNAIKYGPRDEAISVRVSPESSMMLVEVSDRGPGIPLDEQPYLFDRFFRGRAGVSSSRGSGLGLSIAKAIVEAHEGDIGLRGGRQKGTTFWFTLPGG